ncbi:MAG TPA: hypothetical protein VH500_05645 [Nitrososphaeraceae archaeon]|jgi:hypothetical protein
MVGAEMSADEFAKNAEISSGKEVTPSLLRLAAALDSLVIDDVLLNDSLCCRYCLIDQSVCCTEQ